MVGTPFHHTHVGLEKWFLLIDLLINTDTQYSSRQIAKIIDVNKNTAYRMIRQIDLALLNIDHRKLLKEIASYDR
jgi:transposase-like protein